MAKNINRNSEEAREQAFEKRYGKKVRIKAEYTLDGKQLKDYTLLYTSPKNKSYRIKEYLKNDITDYVIFSKQDRQWKFDRFLDAEISLVDCIADE